MTESEPFTCYVGLGSNLGEPRRQVRSAIDALDRLPATRLLQVSQLHASRPLGPEAQPDYCNAVARLATRLSPYGLLTQLQQTEQAHGRQRGERWGARTLDLDLLLYDRLLMVSARLVIPHPGLSMRDFVLYPLAEIAPSDLEVPGLGRLEELLERCPRRYLIQTS